MKKRELFDLPTDWEIEWQDMPEFIQEHQPPFREVIVRFRNEEDLLAFGEVVEQTVTRRTKSIWFPKLIHGIHSNKRYIDEVDNEG